ncbi:MAG: hypothetical protein ACRD4S_04670 [Candidatus Acidiferrales bacterium]
MLTIFSTPKPFQGHIGIIQRNALQSWKRIHPNVEIILFGDEEGASEAAREFGLRHVPNVPRNEFGTKFLTPVFDQAQEMARYDLLCYVNCDIVLLSDFQCALDRVSKRYTRFLVVGRRWDTSITRPIDFQNLEWQENIGKLARKENHRRPANWIDYFGFSRGLYHGNTPAFVIGRPGWDNWLLWKARASGAKVIDASEVVIAIHQNHDYSYHPQGAAGVWQGDEAQKNYELLDGGRCFATIENATHRLNAAGFQLNLRHWFVVLDRWMRARISNAWFAILDVTRRARHPLGIRRGSATAGGSATNPSERPARQ